jgi:hypothetical protein
MADERPTSLTSPSTCQKIKYDNRNDTRDHVRLPITDRSAH